MDKINNIGLARELLKVYDFDGFTPQEVWSRIAQKINIIIEHFNYLDKKFDNQKELVDSKLNYLFNEGLTEQVSKKIIALVNDGTIGELINGTLLKEINDKVDGNITLVNNKLDLLNANTVYISDFPRLDNETDDYNRLIRAYNFCKLKLILNEDLDLGEKEFIIDKQIELHGYGNTISNTIIKINSSFCYLHDFTLISNMEDGIRINETTVGFTTLENINVYKARAHSFLFESYHGLVYNTNVVNCNSDGSIHGFISKATSTKFVNCKAVNHSYYAFGIISDDIQDNMANAIENIINDCVVQDSGYGLMMYSRKKYSHTLLNENKSHLINGLKTERVGIGLSIGEFEVPSDYLSVTPISNSYFTNCNFENSDSFVVELKNASKCCFNGLYGVTPYYIHYTIDYDTEISFVNSCVLEDSEQLVNIGNGEKCNCYISRHFDVRYDGTTSNKVNVEGHLIKGMEITIYIRGLGGSLTYGGFDDIFVTTNLDIPLTLQYNEVLMTKWVYSGVTNKFLNIVCNKVSYV